jgi:hypothetical protein
VGTIHRQEPGAEELITPGGTVKAWVYYTEVPRVLGKPYDAAERILAAAWFNPSSTWGTTVTDEQKWKRVETQSEQGGKKVSEVGLPVRLTVYRKPEPVKQENPYQSLLGNWRGAYSKDLMLMQFLKVDADGVFMAHITWPAYNKGGGATTLVKGQVDGREIIFQEVKLIKGKGAWLGFDGQIGNKYVGTWRINSRSIQGEHFYFGKEWKSNVGRWNRNGSFSLRKQ